MAKEKKELTTLTLEGLKIYDADIKAEIQKQATSAKDYADSLSDNYDAAGTAETKVKALADGKVKENADAIAALNGADTVEGSVAKQIKDATTALKQEISASAYDDSEIKSRISANETAIETLNGTGAGSVDKKVADAVAAIVSGAPEAYDTLKEISDWIGSHADDASAMNSQITDNKTAIDGLKALIGTLPDTAEAKTIVAYIAEVVGASAADLTAAIATAKTGAVDEAKAYADGLASNYATAAQGEKADSALQAADIKNGTANGTILVGDQAVSVGGLGSAAYVDANTFASADSASALETRVESLESVSIVEITPEQIHALFAETE